MGAGEAAYWDLRDPAGPDPQDDAHERYLLTYARMLDAGHQAAAAGEAALIVEWELPVGTGPVSVRLEELDFLCRTTSRISLWATEPDEESRRLRAAALFTGPGGAAVREQVAAVNAAWRAQLDQPGSRLRPPRITDATR